MKSQIYIQTIIIYNLTKSYGTKKIIDKFSYDFISGKLYLLTGCNGSGKTTLLKVICGLEEYQGIIIRRSKRIVMFTQLISLPQNISVKEYLDMIIKVNKQSNKTSTNEVLLKYNLENYRDVEISKLSKGNIQKLKLISILLIESDVYLFDEPLDGLDDETKEIFINKIKKLIKTKIIIIATHLTNNYNLINHEIIKLGDKNA